MEPLKDQFFNRAFYDELKSSMMLVQPSLNERVFEDSIEGFQALELMDRLKQAGTLIDNCFEGNYLDKIPFVKQLAPKVTGFPGMALPYFVEKYGGEHYEESMETLHYLTRYSSSEFAVRPFIKKDIEKALWYMQKWTQDDNNHVRRLASEGCRPILPWSFKLEEIIDNPDLTAPILNALQKDKDLYVKKSVGNHINDHSKNHPDWVINFIDAWDLSDEHSAWMAKKGVRTLIKEGHPASYGIMGFEKDPQYKLGKLQVENLELQLGDDLKFQIELHSTSDQNQYLNIDFVVYYVKKNGSLSPKVFKLKEVNLGPKETLVIKKKHHFADFSTRKHYAGKHMVSVKVNGVENDAEAFNLVL